MKAELRVGNYVSLHGVPYKVDEIFDSGARLINGDNNYVPEYWYMKPIPLTPEILEKAGFIKDGFGSYNISVNPHKSGSKILSFSVDYLYIKHGNEDKPSPNDDVVTLWNKDITKEFYLHQLQNLYYALTGQELNITLSDKEVQPHTITASDLYNTKIRVTPEESERVQKKAFELGYRWGKQGDKISMVDEPFLFFDDRLFITWDGGDEQYFEQQAHKEITLKDIFG